MTGEPAPSPLDLMESPEYLERDGRQVYTVHHRAIGPRRGGVLIAPPFASERSAAYASGVRWARLLARSGFDALRFDYRGIGESSGEFEDCDLDGCAADLSLAAAHLCARLAGAPLVLHGMRLGAVLASEAFARGIGDALLLWAAPASAREHFWEVLRFLLATELVHSDGAPRPTREERARVLEQGGTTNVGGFFWTRRLWESSVDRPLVEPPAASSRPWRNVELLGRGRTPRMDGDPSRSQVACARFWDEIPRVAPDIDALMQDGMEWLDSKIARSDGDAASR